MTTAAQRPSVLVAYATRMGSTREIAEVVGEVLADAGLRVAVWPAEDVTDQDVFLHDAVVLGSAVYFRRWRPAAVRVLRRNADVLATRPLFLFQSGPCGSADAARRLPAPRRVRRLVELIGAEPPVTFGGRLDAEHADGWMARRMATGELAGDWRDWTAIRAWAATVAATITGAAAGGTAAAGSGPAGGGAA